MADARCQSTLRGRLMLVGINDFDSNKAGSRDEAPYFKRSRIYDIPCTLMMLTRLAVGLEPLNTLDAAHRSPRSVFGIGSPAVPALARPLSETKNCRNVQMAKRLRQIAHPSDAILHCRSSLLRYK